MSKAESDFAPVQNLPGAAANTRQALDKGSTV